MSLVYYSGGGDSRRHLRRGSDRRGGEQMAHAAPLVARRRRAEGRLGPAPASIGSRDETPAVTALHGAVTIDLEILLHPAGEGDVVVLVVA